MGVEFYDMEAWHQNLTAEKLNRLIEDINERTVVPFNERFSINADWVGGRQFLIYNNLVDHVKDQLGYDMVKGRISSLADWQQQRVWGGLQDFSRFLEDTGYLTIITQPSSQTVDEYSLATFSCEVTGGTAPYTYQWKKDGVNVGTNSTDLSFNAAAADNGAFITVTITDSIGSVITSDVVVLGVTSYSFRFDGVSQYAKTTNTITLQSSQDFEIELYTYVYENKKRKFFGTDGAAKAGLFGWELDGRFVLRFSNNWILSNSSVPQTTGNHKINLKRVGGVYTVSVSDGAWIGFQSTYNLIVYIDFIARAFGSLSYEYLDGYCDRFKVWTGGDRTTGVLTHHIPLNNKSQGANQLATVGSINADIFSYNASGWTAI